MTTNDLPATSSNDYKTRAWIYKHFIHIKGYILDSASTAGIALAFLFGFNNDPLLWITQNFTLLYSISVGVAAVFFVLKVILKGENIRFWITDFILIIISILLMWWLINIAIKDDSKEEVQNTNSRTSIATQLSNLGQTQTSHSEELESLNKQLHDLKKQIEELESKQNLEKVEP